MDQVVTFSNSIEGYYAARKYLLSQGMPKQNIDIQPMNVVIGEANRSFIKKQQDVYKQRENSRDDA